MKFNLKKSLFANIFIFGALFSGASFASEPTDDSYCKENDSGVIVNVNGCLNEIRDDASQYMPLQTAEDTKLVEMVVEGNRMIQKFDVVYDGDVDFNDQNNIDTLKNIYIEALPTTGNYTCLEGSITEKLYRSGLVNEYRYSVNGSDLFVSIVLDRQYCEDIGWAKDLK